jgi:flagellar biosynthesis protein FliR
VFFGAGFPGVGSPHWVLAALLFARCLGVTTMLPLGESLQVFPRLLLTVGLAAALLPVVQGTGMEPLTPLLFLAEFIVGVLVASPVRVAVESAEMFGELLDTTRGQTIGSIQDPMGGQVTSDLAAVARIVTLIAAVHFGALEALALGVASSYGAFPCGGVLTSSSNNAPSEIFWFLISVVAGSLNLAALWAVALVTVDLTCVVASRVSQGLSFSSTGALTKMVVTFFLLLLLVHDAQMAPGQWFKSVLGGWW